MSDQPAMDEFTYLSVLIGLILGLGITQLMEGFGRLLQLRDRIIWYWPGKVWGFVLLIFHIQAWWAMYELRHIPHWTFPSFIVVLVQPVLLGKTGEHHQAGNNKSKRRMAHEGSPKIHGILVPRVR